jgi:hypothetical protein
MSARLPVVYLSQVGSATLQQVAEACDLTVENVAADFGGLHDYGIVTRYGSKPESVVRFEKMTEWVAEQVKKHPWIWGCPTCGSPEKDLHPTLQHGACVDDWHDSEISENTTSEIFPYRKGKK